LEGLLEDATAGDPISGLKWTHRSTRRLAKALRRRGLRFSANTIARLLRQTGFSLHTNQETWIRADITFLTSSRV
jgi:Rhodopirellula transposase DDE domain